MEETFLEALAARLRARAGNGGAGAPGVALLWTDATRQFEPFIDKLRAHVPVVTLGAYDPQGRTGPAYWIRCVVDGAIDPPNSTPVIYLPGHAKGAVRAVEEAPEELKPLAELQYRGGLFTQANGTDWTITAFLESREGLGVQVADDQRTKEAILRARTHLADALVDDLRREAPLRAEFFDGLLTPDLDREVLAWLDDREAFEAVRTPEQVAAFAAQVRSKLSADVAEGEIALARALGLRGGGWGRIWQRYAEAPARYPGVEQRLRQARPEGTGKARGLFEGLADAWPQDNDADEDRLRAALAGLAGKSKTDAIETVAALEAEHGVRRGWVWAALGQAPLARSLEHLARLAARARSIPAPKSVADAVEGHATSWWQTDDAVVRAMAAAGTEVDRSAVTAAVRAIYEAWLDDMVRRFQNVVGDDAGGYAVTPLPDWPAGTCLVFFDGLRFDIARRIESALGRSTAVTVEPRLTALPTITSTAKPAVSPVVGDLGPGKMLSPAPKDGGPDLAVSGLRKLLGDRGYQVLEGTESGEPTGRAWTELGDLDEVGHLEPWNLPELIDREVGKVVERTTVLLAAGWQQVVIVTDHGWLYLPGGLPKVDLPVSVTKDDRGRKGRTARLADGAKVPGQTVPWYWDPDVRMAVAPGIAVFEAGKVYEHGGVSPQECVTPVVTVRPAGTAARPLEIVATWTGLRARVTVDGAPPDAKVDIRRKAGDAATSLIDEPRSLTDGAASILLPDEDAEGTSVFVVALSPSGTLLGQTSVTVGG